MAQEQNQEADKALSRLENVTSKLSRLQTSLTTFAQGPDLLDAVMDEDLPSDARNAIDAIFACKDELSRLYKETQTINEDVREAAEFIRKQQSTIEEQNDIIMSLKEKPNIDPNLINETHACVEHVAGIVANMSDLIVPALTDNDGSNNRSGDFLPTSIRTIGDTVGKIHNLVTDMSNATPSGDQLRHKSPKALDTGRALLSRITTRTVSGSTSSASTPPVPAAITAGPSSALQTSASTHTVVAPLKKRSDEDATRLRDLLQNVPNVNTLVRKPLDVVFQLDIRVGDGSSNVTAYPPLPGGLKIPTIMRLATELSAKFGTMTDTKWTKDVIPGVIKSSCLYTKIFVKSGADGLYTACDNCQNNNRMCLRKAKTKENVLVTFIAPLPTPANIDPVPTDDTEELRYWVPRLTESMTA
ncbi:hypothetical protein KCU92_g9675, partial [Aureobasidium melanogenum]|jgi:hypothetical protein